MDDRDYERWADPNTECPVGHTQAVPHKVTGIGVGGFSIDWEKVDGDADIARRVVAYLEDRRVLFGERHCEDERFCVRSALEIRRFLTNEIGRSGVGCSLTASLRAMRVACRAFVDAAGPDARNFRDHMPHQTDRFSLALGELRSVVGWHVAVLADVYGVDVEAELRAIMPPAADDDGAPIDWMPGF